VTVANRQFPPKTGPEIEFVTEVQSIEFPNEWYDANSENHFWFQWRERAAAALIRRAGLAARAPLLAFDIGCGTGITCRQLARTTDWIFDGADLNVDALARCHSGMKRVLYYDILQESPEFKERYDVVILFDVLEHIEHTEPFLRSVLFHLKPGGVLLVNVPALMPLYGTYDTLVGHYRRYTRQTLAREFAPFDVTIVDQVYWGFSMVPLLWLRKQVLGEKTGGADAIRVGFVPPSPIAHSVLKGIMSVETSLLRRPPFGSSVMGAFRKNARTA
jgi:2-polyprenyl-3-methyl-5-hydroxy-6-metoxy-1,4-benzoquinol methylase